MTECRVRLRSKAKPYFRGVLRLAIAAALLYAGLAGMGQAGLAQVSPAAASAGGASASEKHPKFEVVSIKRHTAESGPVQTGPTPDGFRSIGLPMVGIFQWAYALPNQPGVLRGDQIEGDPGWLTGELYDVVAKVDQADLADWQKPEMQQAMLRSMLQAMLAERCKVVVHHESKEVPVYDLVVAKGGPKFKQAETVDTAELRRKHPEGGLMRGSGTMAVQGPNRTQFYAISMAILTQTILPSMAGRPVVDKTGLTGRYDLTIPDLRRLSIAPPAPPAGESQPPNEPPPPATDESIFTVLPEALGLRLESAKGQVDMLVIDDVERPSGN